MIDFGKLKRASATNPNEDVPNAFVGIKGDIFYVPLGIPAEGRFSFADNQKLFLQLFKVLGKYSERAGAQQSSKDRDGAGKGEANRSFTLQIKHGDESITYTLFSGIDDVLNSFDDMRLFGLRSRLARSEEVDYNQIYGHMDKATYLPDGSFYIDSMQLPKAKLAYHSTDLVSLFCFVYMDIKQALGESEGIKEGIKAEAEKFCEAHLTPQDSMFAEHTWENTKALLLEQLQRIDQFTAFKDNAYWDFYQAVESMLYPRKHDQENDGIFWGINNFCYLWEDMCQNVLMRVDPEGIKYADSLEPTPCAEDLNGCFTFSMGKKSTCIKPDLICTRRTLFLLFKDKYLVKFKQQFIENKKLAIALNSYDDYGIKISWSVGFTEPKIKRYFPLAFRMVIDKNPNKRELLKDLDQYVRHSTGLCQRDVAHEFDDTNMYLACLYYFGDIFEFKGVFNVPDEFWVNSEHVEPERALMESFFRDWGGRRYVTTCCWEDQYEQGQMPLTEIDPECSSNKDTAAYMLLDFKYKNKVGDNDIRKQQVYEYAICRNTNHSVQNIFVLPGDEETEVLDSNDGIWRVTWDIQNIMQQYIREGKR